MKPRAITPAEGERIVAVVPEYGPGALYGSVAVYIGVIGHFARAH